MERLPNLSDVKCKNENLHTFPNVNVSTEIIACSKEKILGVVFVSTLHEDVLTRVEVSVK